MKRMLLTAALVSWGVASVVAADSDRQAQDEAAIRRAVESYVAAYNRGDAKALAAMWSPEAVYTSPVDGQQVVGREAIEKLFATILGEAQGTRLEAKSDSIEFISPNVAVEQGTATITPPGWST